MTAGTSTPSHPNPGRPRETRGRQINHSANYGVGAVKNSAPGRGWLARFTDWSMALVNHLGGKRGRMATRRVAVQAADPITTRLSFRPSPAGGRQPGATAAAEPHTSPINHRDQAHSEAGGRKKSLQTQHNTAPSGAIPPRHRRRENGANRLLTDGAGQHRTGRDGGGRSGGKGR
jgi:hypothetical protein